MVAIDDHRVFITAIPKFESSNTNRAWIFNSNDESWTALTNTRMKRYGPSCGYVDANTGPSIVLAGGYGVTTTEVFNIDKKEWSDGPDLELPNYGGTMISLYEEKELLLIGGYSSEPLSQVLRMNSSMTAWEKAGLLATPRFNSVGIAVPVEHLPPNFDDLCPS